MLRDEPGDLSSLSSPWRSTERTFLVVFFSEVPLTFLRFAFGTLPDGF